MAGAHVNVRCVKSVGVVCVGLPVGVVKSISDLQCPLGL